MNPLKRLARFILRKEIKSDEYAIELHKGLIEDCGVTIGELRRQVKSKDDEISRLNLKCEQMRQEILELKKKRPCFKHKPKKGVRK